MQKDVSGTEQITTDSLDDEAKTSGRQAGARKVDMMQLAFWGLMLFAVATASVALAWPQAGGATWMPTMVSMAAFGVVAIVWLARGAGRRLGLFPQRGAAESIVPVNPPRFGWINALDEAVLITEQGGAAVASNTAYRALSEITVSGLGDAERSPTVDRLFGANPGLAAPIFRLSKAAKAGIARREVMPAITLGPEALPVQYEIGVSPLPRERVLWRLRRIAGNEEATGAADLKALYVEDAPMGFFASRPDGTLTYANNWLRELIGLPETATNVRIDDIMRPEFVKLLRRERKSGAPGRADILIRGRDGVEISVQTLTTWTGRGADAAGRTIVIANNGQQVVGGAGRFQPSTASRPPRPDSDPMFDDAPFGAVRLQGGSLEDAIILDTNRALMDLTEGKAAPGGKFSSLFVAEDGQDKLDTKLLDAIDRPVELELAGEETKNVNVFVTLDGYGQPLVAYVIDMTEQKQLELRLAQGEKMQAIGQLAGGVAHDFNNVLTGIILNTDKLTMRHPVGDPSYVELNYISELSNRAAELVKMLLAYARKQTFKREVLNITDTLSEFYILLRQLVDERIELDIKHGRDLPRIRADKNQLETTIINLATNARDAMLGKGTRGGGSLSIRTSRANATDAHKAGFNFVEAGEYLLIEVIDTGQGISEANLEKIFTPFFTTKATGLGTGLGLATVYGIVKQSGGYICPISEVGKGTNFQIYLPALSAEDVPAIEEEQEQSSKKTVNKPVDMAGRGRILLVEDEEGVRGIAAQLLVSRGYEVEESADGEEALEVLQDNPGGFDLIISDVVMPGMDGPTLIREAKELLGNARIVFISGYAERDLADAIDEDREISFLPKPFTMSQLAERVKRELGLRQDEAA
ncbi:MAG: response regulator [Hyphomonadaceae bacterium]